MSAIFQLSVYHRKNSTM